MGRPQKQAMVSVMELVKENRLEDIGFYTLSDYRASQTRVDSPLWRCELLLTSKCNFHCVYCRGLRRDCAGDMPLDTALEVIHYWIKGGLKNVRFSGGEPTCYPPGWLLNLVTECRVNFVDNIAISTNGSAPLEYYEMLMSHGVNDFSISLDSGCCAISEKLVGGIKGSFAKVTENIRELSKLTYVTVGMVFTEDNIDTCVEDVEFVYSLGVADIRVIPAAQFNQALVKLKNLSPEIRRTLPILNYRIKHIEEGRHVRGIRLTDNHHCPLVLDDMAIAGQWHFPCIIYLREGGNPIGRINKDMREERLRWYQNHDCFADDICRYNCLDVCVDYNNKAQEYEKSRR